MQNQTPYGQKTKMPKIPPILLPKYDMIGPKLPWKTAFSGKLQFFKKQLKKDCLLAIMY